LVIFHHSIFNILSVSEVFGKQVDDASFGNYFDWTLSAKSPFWMELRNEVRVIIKESGTTKATTARLWQIAGLLLIALAILPFYVTGYWCALIAFPIAYWVFGVSMFNFIFLLMHARCIS
jgi:inner membrane protein involved in colicin E2 resistance